MTYYTWLEHALQTEFEMHELLKKVNAVPYLSSGTVLPMSDLFCVLLPETQRYIISF